MARKRKFEEDRMRDAALRGAPREPALVFDPPPAAHSRTVLDGKAIIRNDNDRMFWICRPNGYPLEWKPTFDGALERARDLLTKGSL